MADSEVKMKNMTEGNPAKLIFMFALPLLFGNVLQQLYNMVDSIVVGQFVGKTALAAVGTGFPIIFMVSSLFMGIGMGGTVMVSQYLGAGDKEKIRSTIGTIYTAMMVGVVPLTLFGFFASGPLLRMMQVPLDTIGMAETYMKIIFIGLIGSLGYNVNAGILQGLGDSKTSLIFLAIACVLNIILDLLFVIQFNMGVAGVAWATIIAQFSSWILGLIFINKKYPELKVNPLSFHFKMDLFKQAMRLGIPAGIQQMMFSFGVMALQSLVNSHGSDFMAGFNAANKIDVFAFMPLQSFSTAITTYVGQNIGANRMDRVSEGVKATLKMSITFSIFAGIILTVFGEWCLMLFTNDPAVIQAGLAYTYRIAPFYSLLAIMFILNGVMRGAGAVMIPTVSSLFSLWLARIPSAYLLSHFFGRDNLNFCFGIGWAVGVCIAVPVYLSGKWKNMSIVKKDTAFLDDL